MAPPNAMVDGIILNSIDCSLGRYKSAISISIAKMHYDRLSITKRPKLNILVYYTFFFIFKCQNAEYNSLPGPEPDYNYNQIIYLDFPANKKKLLIDYYITSKNPSKQRRTANWKKLFTKAVQLRVAPQSTINPPKYFESEIR